MLSANPVIDDAIKLSRRQLVRLLINNHQKYRSELQLSLQDAQSMIHISTDMWTSPARRGHLAVCAQWLDSSYKLQKALLSLPQVKGTHSGEVQAKHIMDLLKCYGIATRLGYHTGDNATSNDTLMEHLMAQLKEQYSLCLVITSRLSINQSYRLQLIRNHVVYAISITSLTSPFKPSS